MRITYNQAMKEINKEFKNLGLQAKTQNSTINGMKAFKVLDRDSGVVLDNNFTLWSMYENMLNGYFETLK